MPSLWGVGEPDFVHPLAHPGRGHLLSGEGFTKYTSNAGMAELRREIAAYLNRRFGLQYDFAHQIVVTVGAAKPSTWPCGASSTPAMR